MKNTEMSLSRSMSSCNLFQSWPIGSQRQLFIVSVALKTTDESFKKRSFARS